MKAQGINVPAKIGTSAASSEKAAETTAFSDALENMTKFGITNEWIAAQKFNREFNIILHPELTNLLNPIKEKMKQLDLVRISFETMNTNLGPNIKLLQLKGYKNGFQRLILLGSDLIVADEKSNTFTEKYLELLRKFIESK
jgi:hypothetical protein